MSVRAAPMLYVSPSQPANHVLHARVTVVQSHCLVLSSLYTHALALPLSPLISPCCPLISPTPPCEEPATTPQPAPPPTFPRFQRTTFDSWLALRSLHETHIEYGEGLHGFLSLRRSSLAMSLACTCITCCVTTTSSSAPSLSSSSSASGPSFAVDWTCVSGGGGRGERCVCA